MQEVAHSDVIPLLVELCNGQAGPLAAIDLNDQPPVEDKKKKGKAKPKKKVSAQIEMHIHISNMLRRKAPD